MIRHDWTRDEVLALSQRPLSDLLCDPQTILRARLGVPG
jgi:hypothetical protein